MFIQKIDGVFRNLTYSLFTEISKIETHRSVRSGRLNQGEPMHSVTFLQDLAVVMIVAGVITVFFHYFKQPVVLGYIIAGVIIGPHTLPFPLISDETSIETLAQLGVIFLMFSFGA
jgi:hypothetical protein